MICSGSIDDTVSGSAFNNDMHDDDGDDRIERAASNDTVIGGSGGDDYMASGRRHPYADAADTSSTATTGRHRWISSTPWASASITTQRRRARHGQGDEVKPLRRERLLIDANGGNDS